MSSASEWLASFEAREGRPLRVLHLGNIANNAYNNAKIQRQRGIDADVSSNDYFHTMACPEWEDADFEGDVVDQLFPDWWNVDLRGFRRPEWFAQGNVRTCQRYLLARSTGSMRARFYRRALTAERWLWCRSTPFARLVGYRGGVLGIARSAVRIPRALVRIPVGVGDLARGKGLRATAQDVLPSRLGARLSVQAVDESDIGRRYADAFPDRTPLLTADVRGYRIHARGWRDVFRGYDIVQGYALDAVTPVLCAVESWAAYEHGTLRSLPFEESASGRISALAFHEAPVVFVTNSDVVPAARRLGLTEAQLVFLPHAVDSDRLFRFAAANETLRPGRDGPVRFFSPTRHDWLDGDPSWAKGNDRLIRGFRLLCDGRVDAQLTLIAWGRHLAATKALVAKLGLDDRVRWIAPRRKTELWIEYIRAHAVADQFVIRALGGVAFEAMALGCRVLTAIDDYETTEFFGAPPPLLACSDPDEVAAAMRRVADDPLDDAGRGAAARAWFEGRHSADRIVDLQVAAYRRLLEFGRPTPLGSTTAA